VQKFSQKGWICKTWEGEMATVTMPGTAQEKFLFTVRSDDIAAQVNKVMGKHPPRIGRSATIESEHERLDGRRSHSTARSTGRRNRLMKSLSWCLVV
jgi:hypothetical protein